MTGLSATNLQYMRAFAAAWPTERNFPTARGEIAVGPRPHPARPARRPGPAGLVRRTGRRQRLVPAGPRAPHRAPACTAVSAPPPATSPTTSTTVDADQAQEIVKDPYVFDFLDLTERSRERAIETALTERLQDTLAELGPGFAFVGRQVHFAVDGDEFFVDLLCSTPSRSGTWSSSSRSASSGTSSPASWPSTSPWSTTNSGTRPGTPHRRDPAVQQLHGRRRPVRAALRQRPDGRRHLHLRRAPGCRAGRAPARRGDHRGVRWSRRTDRATPRRQPPPSTTTKTGGRDHLSAVEPACRERWATRRRTLAGTVAHPDVGLQLSGWASQILEDVRAADRQGDDDADQGDPGHHHRDRSHQRVVPVARTCRTGPCPSPASARSGPAATR